SFVLRFSPPPSFTLFPYTTLFRSFLCHLLLQQLFPQTAGILLLCLLLCFVLIVNLNGYELSLRLQVLMTLLVVTMMVGLSTMALDRKSTRLNSSHQIISYAVFCLK